MFIKYIFETYPDAIIIQTHRHPAEAIALWSDMVTKMRTTFSNNTDKAEIGQTQLKAMKEMVESVQNFRDSHPELSDRFIDVQHPSFFLFFFLTSIILHYLILIRYNDLFKKPFETIMNVSKQLNMEITPAQLYEKINSNPLYIVQVQEWLVSLKKLSVVPAESSLDKFNVSKEQVDDAFSSYIKRYNL